MQRTSGNIGDRKVILRPYSLISKMSVGERDRGLRNKPQRLWGKREGLVSRN